MTTEERLKAVTISGSMRGVQWIEDLAIQAGRTAAECDSSFHECVAITLRRAATEIVVLQAAVRDIRRTLENMREVS